MITKTQILYNIVYDMRMQAQDALVSGDRGVMAIYSPGKPVWIWTQPRCATDGLRVFFREFIRRNEAVFGVVAEQAVARLFAAEYAAMPPEMAVSRLIDQEREKVAYYTRELLADNGPGRLSQPGEQDLAVLAEWLAWFYDEALHEPLSFEQRKIMARALLSSGRLFTLTEAGTIRAMGTLTEQSGDMCRINFIFTPFRGFGYGKSITAKLANRALERGQTPMLYTDSDNAAANHIYRALRFVEAGRLTEIRFHSKIVGGTNE